MKIGLLGLFVARLWSLNTFSNKQCQLEVKDVVWGFQSILVLEVDYLGSVMGFTDALWLAKFLFNYDLLGVLPQDRYLSVDSDCAGCGQNFFVENSS